MRFFVAELVAKTSNHQRYAYHTNCTGHCHYNCIVELPVYCIVELPEYPRYRKHRYRVHTVPVPGYQGTRYNCMPCPLVPIRHSPLNMVLHFIMKHDWTAWLDEPSKPLAVAGMELFVANPRSASSPAGFFLNPLNVVILVVLYFLSIPVLRTLCENYPMSAKEQETAWEVLYNEIKESREKRLKAAKTKEEKVTEKSVELGGLQKVTAKAKKSLDDLGSLEKFKLTAIRGFNGSASTAFKVVEACHNLILIIFSATVMLRATPLVIGWGQEHGLLAAYCDVDKSMWNNGGFGFWATVFYLSKYYEFVDTWLIVCKVDTRTGKRKTPSLLQTYHHAGIALTMYGSTVSQSAWIAWIVIINSTIHTLMYTYFLASTFGYKSPWAKYLTGLQLLQFLTCIAMTIGVHVLGEACDSEASRVTLAIIQFYAVGLIVLFGSFFQTKYKKE